MEEGAGGRLGMGGLWQWLIVCLVGTGSRKLPGDSQDSGVRPWIDGDFTWSHVHSWEGHFQRRLILHFYILLFILLYSKNHTFGA